MPPVSVPSKITQFFILKLPSFLDICLCLLNRVEECLLKLIFYGNAIGCLTSISPCTSLCLALLLNQMIDLIAIECFDQADEADYFFLGSLMRQIELKQIPDKSLKLFVLSVRAVVGLFWALPHHSIIRRFTTVRHGALRLRKTG